MRAASSIQAEIRTCLELGLAIGSGVVGMTITRLFGIEGTSAAAFAVALLTGTGWATARAFCPEARAGNVLSVSLASSLFGLPLLAMTFEPAAFLAALLLAAPLGLVYATFAWSLTSPMGELLKARSEEDSDLAWATTGYWLGFISAGPTLMGFVMHDYTLGWVAGAALAVGFGLYHSATRSLRRRREFVASIDAGRAPFRWASPEESASPATSASLPLIRAELGSASKLAVPGSGPLGGPFRSIATAVLCVPVRPAPLGSFPVRYPIELLRSAAAIVAAMFVPVLVFLPTSYLCSFRPIGFDLLHGSFLLHTVLSAGASACVATLDRPRRLLVWWTGLSVFFLLLLPLANLFWLAHS